jgi:hypothetical protein
MRIRISTVVMFAVAAVSSCVAVVGCSGQAAAVRQRQESARALAAAAPRPTVATVAKASEHFAKPAARDSAFAKYADPGYGVSFRYPRNFALIDSGDFDSTEEDGDSDRVISWQQAKQAGAGVRTAEELSADDPGAALLATIVVPDDAYPNTSFAGGSVQFAVNRYQTAGSCRANLAARVGDAKGASGTVNAQDVSFAWTDTDAGDGNTEFSERDYAGFADGACYEFFVRVGVKSAAGATLLSISNTTGGGTADGTPATGGLSSVTSEESAGSRRPDERRIIAHLEKIVASLQVESASASASVLDKPRYKSAPTFPASN